MTRPDILALREIAVSTMDDARMLRERLGTSWPPNEFALEAGRLHNIGSRLYLRSEQLEAELDRKIQEATQ